MWQQRWQAVVLVTGALAMPAQAQVHLEWNLREGDKFYLQTTAATKQTITIKNIGTHSQQEFETSSVDSYKVVKRTADQIVLEKRVESMKVKATGQSAEMAVQMYQSLKGAVFKLTLDTPTQAVTKVEAVDPEFFKKAFPLNSVMEVTMSAMLTEDNVRDEQQCVLLGFLPHKPVTKGDKWTRKSRIPLGPIGAFSADGEFTYRGKNPLDRIDATWALTYAHPKWRPRSGLPVAITKGDFKELTAKGTYYFDAGSGRLVQLDREYHIKGTITMSAIAPQPGPEMSMEMRIDQTSTIRLLDRPPASQ